MGKKRKNMKKFAIVVKILGGSKEKQQHFHKKHPRFIEAYYENKQIENRQTKKGCQTHGSAPRSI